MIDNITSNSFSSHQRLTKAEDNTIELQMVDVPESIIVNRDPKLEEKKVKEIVDSLNNFMQAAHTSLKFEFHDKLNEYYVTITDDVTKEVVREIPSKKMLDMYAAMTEFLGLMVDKKI